MKIKNFPPEADPPLAEKFKIQNLRSGISLIEAVIYVAILALLSVFVIDTLLAISSVYGKAKVKRQIVFEAESGLERIVRETRLASGVDIFMSSLGSNPSTVQLASVISADDATPITKKIYISAGRLFLQEGASPPIALTSEKVNIKSFIASYISTPVSEALKYNLMVSGGSGKASSSAEFFSTAVLRRSY